MMHGAIPRDLRVRKSLTNDSTYPLVSTNELAWITNEPGAFKSNGLPRRYGETRSSREFSFAKTDADRS